MAIEAVVVHVFGVGLLDERTDMARLDIHLQYTVALVPSFVVGKGHGLLTFVPTGCRHFVLVAKQLCGGLHYLTCCHIDYNRHTNVE